MHTLHRNKIVLFYWKENLSVFLTKQDKTKLFSEVIEKKRIRVISCRNKIVEQQQQKKGI